jgi:hypothetical protein
MFPQRWLPHWSNSLFLLSVFLGGFFCNGSFSQEPSSQDARTRNDKQGRIVGVTYLGQGGLPLRPTQYIVEIPNSAYSRSPQCNISHETTSYNLDGSPEKNLG